jgi:putative PIN family toxin of toxin-antitoxin system
MVFLQGAGRPAGPARACLRLVEEDRVTLCVSAEVLAEVRDVLTRPKMRQKFPALTPEWVEQFVRTVQSKALLVADVAKVFTYSRDPKDERYVNLAVEAGAEYLVSRDKDLLDLMDPSQAEGADFQRRFPSLLILDPVRFLSRLPGPPPSGVDSPGAS